MDTTSGAAAALWGGGRMMESFMTAVDWAWQYMRAYPWILIGILPCSYAAHVGTNWIKGVRKEKTGRSPGKRALEGYSFLLAVSLSSMAFSHSRHLEGADQALLLGLLMGFGHYLIIKSGFAICRRWFPTANAILEGEVYDDDPTQIKTIVVRALGAKVRAVDTRKRDRPPPDGIDRRK